MPDDLAAAFTALGGQGSFIEASAAPVPKPSRSLGFSEHLIQSLCSRRGREPRLELCAVGRG
jgi:hypothetical protein